VHTVSIRCKWAAMLDTHHRTNQETIIYCSRWVLIQLLIRLFCFAKTMVACLLLVEVPYYAITEFISTAAHSLTHWVIGLLDHKWTRGREIFEYQYIHTQMSLLIIPLRCFVQVGVVGVDDCIFICLTRFLILLNALSFLLLYGRHVF
jgi:hypothetical protein